jgi:hypothetical protein
VTDDERRPWERQPAETDAAWSAFVSFRDAGPAARKVGEHGAWSSKFAWRERAAAWYAYADRALEGDRLEGLADMRERHLAVARDMLEVCRLEIGKRLARAKAQPSVATISVRDLMDLIEKAMRLERLAAGEAESRNELQSTWAEIVASASLPDDD